MPRTLRSRAFRPYLRVTYGCMCQETSCTEQPIFSMPKARLQKDLAIRQRGSSRRKSTSMETDDICRSSRTMRPFCFSLSAVKNQSIIGHGKACLPSMRTRSRSAALQRGRYCSDGSVTNSTVSNETWFAAAKLRILAIFCARSNGDVPGLTDGKGQR